MSRTPGPRPSSRQLQRFALAAGHGFVACQHCRNGSHRSPWGWLSGVSRTTTTRPLSLTTALYSLGTQQSGDAATSTTGVLARPGACPLLSMPLRPACIHLFGSFICPTLRPLLYMTLLLVISRLSLVLLPIVLSWLASMKTRRASGSGLPGSSWARRPRRCPT